MMTAPVPTQSPLAPQPSCPPSIRSQEVVLHSFLSISKESVTRRSKGIIRLACGCCEVIDTEIQLVWLLPSGMLVVHVLLKRYVSTRYFLRKEGSAAICSVSNIGLRLTGTPIYDLGDAEGIWLRNGLRTWLEGNRPKSVGRLCTCSASLS
jgi:hypothetical protein